MADGVSLKLQHLPLCLPLKSLGVDGLNGFRRSAQSLQWNTDLDRPHSGTRRILSGNRQAE